MKFNKRASLEIGINTIVILVIAMTLLGLGVVFVRNLFLKVGGTVDIIEPGDISNPPTSDTPIRLVPSTVQMKAGSQKTVDVLVYNKGPGQCFQISIPQCSGGEEPVVEPLGEYIEQGSYKGFRVLLEASYEDSGNSVPMSSKKTVCRIKAMGVETRSDCSGNAPNEPEVYTAQFIMDVTA